MNNNIYDTTDIANVQTDYKKTVPHCFQTLRIWTNWQYVEVEGKITKRIFRTDSNWLAKSNEPGDWVDFETALAAITPKIGLCMAMPLDGSYTGFDFDNCFDPATGAFLHWPDAPIQPEALAQSMQGTYSYVTPSKEGLRIFITSDVPKPDGSVFKFGPDDSGKKREFEVYDRARFFTVMPTLFAGGTSTIENRTGPMLDFYKKVRPESEPSREPETSNDGPTFLSVEDISEFANDMAGGITGDRHHALLAMAGVLWKADWSDSSIEMALTEACLELGKNDPKFDVKGRLRKALGFLLAVKKAIARGKDRGKIAGWHHLKQHVDPAVVAKWQSRAGMRSWKTARVHTKSALPPGFEMREDGLYFVPSVPGKSDEAEAKQAKSKPDKVDHPVWICDRLEVTASSRTSDSEEWGKVLVWHDPSAGRHEWAMPTGLLCGDGSAIREHLLTRGLSISSAQAARERLLAYLVKSGPTAKIRAVTQTGWYENCFVLPFETIGKAADGESVILQTPGLANSETYAAKGTLFTWQGRISLCCAGNSRLVFAVSAAFAGPLLKILDEQNGGFHFRGPTSTGKSTALAVAASVWGSPKFRGSWRTTSNGLEGAAALHNDSLLLLDEIDEAPAHDLGPMVYMLANGQGKQRMTRNITVRKPLNWRFLFMSSGETSMSAHMSTAGKKTKGGQEVRCLDIPADAQRGMGAFEDIHDRIGAAAFSDALQRACHSDYGVAGRMYVKAMISANLLVLRPKLQATLAKYVNEIKPPDASPEVGRACKKFALVAVAGELATGFGITDWRPGTALAAAKVCFRAWMDERGGTGSSDIQSGLRQVRRFLEAHGSSRFQDMGFGGHESAKLANDARIFNRAGFKEKRGKHSNEWNYYILPETFQQEVCLGYDHKAIAKAMRDAGMLETAPNRGLKVRISPIGMGRIEVFHVTAKIFEPEPEAKSSDLADIFVTGD